MAHSGIDHLRLARRWAVTKTVIGSAKKRPAFNDLARNAELGLCWVVAFLWRDDPRIDRRTATRFDRLLARFFAEKNAPWLLKGGYAMELRLRTARTTKDIDISLPAEMVDAFGRDVVKLVQQSARIELADFFTFVIGESQFRKSRAWMPKRCRPKSLERGLLAPAPASKFVRQSAALPSAYPSSGN